MHVRRRRLQAGHRHVRRRDGGAAARPAPSERGVARAPARRSRRRRASASRGRRTSRCRGSGSGRSSRSSSTSGSIELADESIREVCGTSHRLPSGPLHDAAEVARAGVPTVMLFVQSLRGLSHTKLEDTKKEHLELVGAGARPVGVEDARKELGMSDDLFGEEHVRRYRRDGRRGGLHLARGRADPHADDDGPQERARSRRRRSSSGCDGDNSVIVASQGGAPEHPGWYLQSRRRRPRSACRSRPTRSAPARATREGEERERLWTAMNEIWPHYDEYQAKTDREIPVVVLERV